LTPTHSLPLTHSHSLTHSLTACCCALSAHCQLTHCSMLETEGTFTVKSHIRLSSYPRFAPVLQYPDMGISTFKNHVEVSDDSVQGCYDGGQQVCLFGAVGGSGRAAVVSGCVRVRVGGWFHGLEDGAAEHRLFLCSFVRWLVCSFVCSRRFALLRCLVRCVSLSLAVAGSWQ